MSTTSRRVVVVSDALSERNGVGTYYADLAAHLVSCGVELKTIHPGGAVSEWLNMPLIGDRTQRLALPSPTALARELRRLAPSHVVVPTPGPYGMLGAWLGARMDARIVMPLHTDFRRMMNIYWNPLIGKIARGWFWVANKCLLRFAQTVLASSPLMIEDARELGAREAKLQLMGTPLARVFLESKPPEVREAMNRVLFVGRLAAEKNVGQVLAAAESLPALRFAIAGDGPERAGVEAAAARLANLEYLGWLDRRDTCAAMDETDLLVLPSRLESFGTVVLEAMARRCAVLVSPGCGITQWPCLAEGLFVMADEASLAEEICRVKNLSPGERTAITERGHAAAVDFNRTTLEGWLRALDAADAIEV